MAKREGLPQRRLDQDGQGREVPRAEEQDASGAEQIRQDGTAWGSCFVWEMMRRSYCGRSLCHCVEVPCVRRVEIRLDVALDMSHTDRQQNAGLGNWGSEDLVTYHSKRQSSHRLLAQCTNARNSLAHPVFLVTNGGKGCAESSLCR